MKLTGIVGGAARRPGALLTVAALGVGALLGGCAGAAKVSEGFIWPEPPETGRVKFIRTIAAASDFEQGFWTSLKRALLGESHTKDVQYPTALALSPDETKLLVGSGAMGTILQFDLVNSTIAIRSGPEGQRAISAFGLALDANDNLYVTDQVRKEIVVYTPSDDLLREIGKGMLVRPTGIAIDRKRQILYVSDSGTGGNPRHVVEVFALDGRHLRTIGKEGDGPGQFEYPAFLAVAPDGKLFVSEAINSRVQIFDGEGTYVNQFGSLGDGPGQFGKPKGIAFDSFGNIYVVDGQLGWVQIFNPDFQPLMSFAGQVARPEFFLTPNAIAITSKNEIYVADYTGKVNEYRLINTRAEDSYRRPAAAPAAPAASPSAGSGTASQPEQAAPAPSAPPAASPGAN